MRTPVDWMEADWPAPAPVRTLLTTRAGIQLTTGSGALRVGGIAEAAVHHLLHAPFDQAPLHEDVAATVSIEGARGVAHDTMDAVLTADSPTQRRGSDRGGNGGYGEEQRECDECLLHCSFLGGKTRAVRGVSRYGRTTPEVAAATASL